jgi:hypothetical protein
MCPAEIMISDRGRQRKSAQRETDRSSVFAGKRKSNTEKQPECQHGAEWSKREVEGIPMKPALKGVPEAAWYIPESRVFAATGIDQEIFENTTPAQEKVRTRNEQRTG